MQDEKRLASQLGVGRATRPLGVGTCVMWCCGGKGVMREISVLESHADRKACTNRGEMSCVCVKVCKESTHNVCVYAEEFS